MPDTTKGEAVIQAEAMRKAIEAAEFTVAHDTMPIKVTMSFGIAECEGPNQSIEGLLHSADLAMYEAKEAGRNQCCVYDSWTPDSALQDSQWSTPVEVNRTMSKHPKANTSDTRPSSSGGWQGDPTDRGVPKRRSAPAFEIAETKPGSKRVVRLYAGSVALLALILGVALLRPTTGLDVIGLLLFVALTALLEWWSTDAYSINIAVSTSVATMIASTLLFGPVGAVAAGLTISIVAQLKVRWDQDRFLFTASNILIGGLICAGLLAWSGVDYAALSAAWQIVGALACALVMYASNTVLAAGFAAIRSAQSWPQLWRERYLRLGIQYGAMGLLAFALIYFYLLVGVFGVLIMLVPLSLLHYGQREYLSATKHTIEALQTAYEQLANKKSEIEKLNEELLLALASTIDLRDPDVLEHSRQVARYAVLTAEEMGLSVDEVRLVRTRRADARHRQARHPRSYPVQTGPPD